MAFIDFRSDSVTQPTDEMRQAMAQAPVGDDFFGEDPSVIELENYGASLTGKQAAIFVPSATFANQLALFCHCNPGDEVIIDENSHIVQKESGAAALISGVNFRTFVPKNSVLCDDDLICRIRTGHEPGEPKTALICLENTMSCGNTIPLKQMQSMRYITARYHVPVHLDGARLFNAAASLNISAAEIAQNADTVTLCLSKGLCAPAGGLLCGSKEFIEKARQKRRLLGGEMHKVGGLAAAGLIGLKQMRQCLVQDHETAFYLANSLTQFAEIEVDITRIETNMVTFKFREDNFETEAFEDFFKHRNILLFGPNAQGTVKLYTHHWINKQHVDSFVKTLKEFLQD